MSRLIDDYRKQAETCRKLASNGRDAFQKTELLKLADQWETLANEREKMLKTQAKLRSV